MRRSTLSIRSAAAVVASWSDSGIVAEVEGWGNIAGEVDVDVDVESDIDCLFGCCCCGCW